MTHFHIYKVSFQALTVWPFLFGHKLFRLFSHILNTLCAQFNLQLFEIGSDKRMKSFAMKIFCFLIRYENGEHWTYKCNFIIKFLMFVFVGTYCCPMFAIKCSVILSLSFPKSKVQCVIILCEMRWLTFVM